MDHTQTAVHTQIDFRHQRGTLGFNRRLMQQEKASPISMIRLSTHAVPTGALPLFSHRSISPGLRRQLIHCVIANLLGNIKVI